jgi:ribosome-dependent ATPase
VLPATQFAGMMTPVSSLSNEAQIVGRAFPMTYFVPVCVGTFTKGLGFSDLAPDLLALAIFVPILTLLGVVLLRKQQP